MFEIICPVTITITTMQY